MPDYLVAFVADAVDDALAATVRDRVRELAGARAWEVAPPGFFDDPEAPDPAQRTMGTYLRSPFTQDEIAALAGLVRAVSAEHAVTFEVQLAEEVLGHVSAGVADAGLQRSLPAFAA